MWLPLTIFIVWLAGYFIMACLVGVFYQEDEDLSDTEGMTVILLLWPVIAIVIICVLIVMFPFEIGKVIRGK